MDYVDYLERVGRLRDDVIEKSGVKFVEGLKIWARYIITHISLFQERNRYTVLPGVDVYDHQFVQELILNGCSNGVKLYEELKARTAELCPPPMDQRIEIPVVKEGEYLSYHQVKHLVSKSLYDKLCRLYRRDSTERNQYIWLVLTLYQLLDGHSLQWAVPPSVMWIFKEKFNCDTDIFASPLNTYNSKYYSLFYFDTYFGSRGNFFTAPDSDFTAGTFHVNPPFIVPVFTRTTARILELLGHAEETGNVLTFIYVMPDWTEFDTYNTVYMNRFGKKHIYIPAGKAYYHQYRTDTSILSTFGTHIFILSTAMDTICTDEIEQDILVKFGTKGR